MNLLRLAAAEEIKKLKARYLRLMDQRRWDQWSELFAEDAKIQVFQEGKETHFWQGIDQIVASNTKLNTAVRSIHQGHTPEIDFTSETTATGIWALSDLYVLPNGKIRSEAYGYYEDQYVKKNGCWKIQSVKCMIEAASN